MTTLNFDPTLNAGFGAYASLSDASGQRLVISDRYADLLMRSKDDLLHLPWQAIAHPDDLKLVALPFNRMVTAGEPYQTRCRVMRSDGQYLSLNYRVVRFSPERSGRIIIQSNFKLAEEPPAITVGSDLIDGLALTSYIRDVAGELGGLAGQHGMSMLQHLLSMASVEARDEIVRLEAERRANARDRGMRH